MDASWITVIIVAVTAVGSAAFTLINSSKSDGKWTGVVDTKLDNLHLDLNRIRTSIESHMQGDCPISKRVETVENRVVNVEDDVVKVKIRMDKFEYGLDDLGRLVKKFPDKGHTESA